MACETFEVDGEAAGSFLTSKRQRFDAEYRGEDQAAAEECCAVKHAIACFMNAPVGKTAVRVAVFKVVQGLEICSVLVQPEYGAPTQCAIVVRRAIERAVASLD